MERQTNIGVISGNGLVGAEEGKEIRTKESMSCVTRKMGLQRERDNREGGNKGNTRNICKIVISQIFIRCVACHETIKVD